MLRIRKRNNDYYAWTYFDKDSINNKSIYKSAIIKGNNEYVNKYIFKEI